MHACRNDVCRRLADLEGSASHCSFHQEQGRMANPGQHSCVLYKYNQTGASRVRESPLVNFQQLQNGQHNVIDKAEPRGFCFLCMVQATCKNAHI